MCDRLERVQSWQGSTQGKGPGHGRGIVDKELLSGRVAEEMTEARKEARKGSMGSKLDWYGDKDKGGTGNKGEGKNKGKNETPYCCDCGEQGHVGMNCPYKWTNSIDEEDDQGSSWESEPEGKKAEELASVGTLDDEGEWCWPRRNRITRWEGGLIQDQHFTTMPKMTRMSKRLED